VEPGTVGLRRGPHGRGKSSLISTILRLVEPSAGGASLSTAFDLARLALRAMRERIGVISQVRVRCPHCPSLLDTHALTLPLQDPLFFYDTLRRDLDPFNNFTDHMLVSALRDVELYEPLVTMGQQQRSKREKEAEAAAYAAGGEAQSISIDAAVTSPLLAGGSSDASGGSSCLDVHIEEHGSNLSAGQQQLLALARSLLQRPRVVLMDEPYASLDPDTEMKVHAKARKAFEGCTVIQVRGGGVCVGGPDCTDRRTLWPGPRRCRTA